MVERVLFMNNKQLQYAIELSKTLNFSLAAEKLGISQPALSKQILDFEKKLGVKLFNREKNSVNLSCAGKYFLENAEKLLFQEEQLCRSLDVFKSENCGELIIGVSPFRSLYLLPTICKKIKEKFPGVRVILHEDTSEHLRNNTSDGKYDFAIVNLPVDESVLDVTPIERDKLALVVPKNMLGKIKSYEDTEIPTVSLKECEDLPFIVVGKTQEMRILFDKMCSSIDIQPTIAMEVVGLTTAWAMSRAGIGATLLPMQLINSLDACEQIQIFNIDFKTNIRQPAIINRHGQYLSKYAKYAIELLKDY